MMCARDLITGRTRRPSSRPSSRTSWPPTAFVKDSPPFDAPFFFVVFVRRPVVSQARRGISLAGREAQEVSTW